MVKINFLPIDLEFHSELCVNFAEDMDTCSFGSTKQFHGADGKGAERYLARLREKLSADPACCLHAWLDGEIVGQMNLGCFIDPSIGYLSVFYAIPAWRGKGVANQMEEHATQWFARRRFPSARLSVAPTNVRAVRFYHRCGWRDLGPRVDKPELHNMEKKFR